MTPIQPVLPSAPQGGPGLRSVTWAKDQPQYRDLPSLVSSNPQGCMTTRWRLTWPERIQVFLHGNLWLRVLTFHNSLQPVALLTEEPAIEDCL